MIRAAAKNHADVAVVVDAADYGRLLDHLASGAGGEAFAAFRRELAWKAFQHCATYDSTVAEWLWMQTGERACGCRAGPLCCIQKLPHVVPAYLAAPRCTWEQMATLEANVACRDTSAYWLQVSSLTPSQIHSSRHLCGLQLPAQCACLTDGC